MDISKMTIGEAREIAALFAGAAAPQAPVMIPGHGRRVIVRSRDQGVNYGSLVEYSADGAIVKLANARQIWSWTAAQGGTLLDCATHGLSKGKLSAVAPAVIVIGACAIIDVSDSAVKSLEGATWA